MFKSGQRVMITKDDTDFNGEILKVDGNELTIKLEVFYKVGQRFNTTWKHQYLLADIGGGMSTILINMITGRCYRTFVKVKDTDKIDDDEFNKLTGGNAHYFTLVEKDEI